MSRSKNNRELHFITVRFTVLLSDDVIRVYRFTDPETPTICKRGEIAEAEPAVPTWTMLVDELFD